MNLTPFTLYRAARFSVHWDTYIVQIHQQCLQQHVLCSDWGLGTSLLRRRRCRLAAVT